MSIHSSLKATGKLGGHRNVLTRPERLVRLLEEGAREESDSVFGLQKVRNILMKTKKTKKDKDEDSAEEVKEAGSGDKK